MRGAVMTKIRATLNTDLNNINAEVNNLNSELVSSKEAKAAATELATKVFLNAINIENDLFGSAIDLVQRATSDINPLRAMLKGWIKDIEDSMLAYIDTNAEMIKQTMITGGDPIQPLNEWWSCWGQSLFGAPAPATTAICSVRNKIDEITQAMDDFERSILELTPIGSEFQKFKDKINNEINALQEELSIQILEAVTNFPVRKLLGLLKTPASDAGLDYYFGQDHSSFRHKGLLEISDMSARVKAEMHTVNHEFDPQKFNVVYNAVIFAKLSLLGATSLNELAGSSLYDESSTTPVNILLGSIRSIDGNHQWMEIAPPYPRREGLQDGGWPQDRTYGYGEKFNAGGQGLLVWTDCTSRNLIFRNVFLGPLVPGIETPEINGFSRLLSTTYPSIYSVSSSPYNPFPELNSDRIIDNCIATAPVDPNINDADNDGLTDAQEVVYATLDFNSDTDNDGMTDGYEVQAGFNPLDPSDALLDADSDGLNNLNESLYGTDPFNFDTDGDGMSDWFEVNYRLDVFNNTDGTLDADGDLLINLHEYQNKTNPLNSDTDSDGIQDNYEVEQGLNPLFDDSQSDLDNDGLTNEEEYLLGTAANNSDTDSDGMPDNLEYKIIGLDPLVDDSQLDLDGDGISNIDEINAGTDFTGVSEKALVNLSAKIGNKKLTLSWNAVDNVDNYNIYWSESPGVTKLTGTKISDVSNPYEHTGLINRKDYYYVVTAENVYGESPESVEIKDRPDDFSWLIPILNIVLD
jgi:hypothetical protein